mgnify:CR=1 FL=1
MSCSILKLLPHSPVQDNSVYKKTRSELRKPEVNKIKVPANKAVTSEKTQNKHRPLPFLQSFSHMHYPIHNNLFPQR